MGYKKLNGKRVAVLLENGFDQSDFIKPMNALREAGASVYIISKHKKVRSWNKKDWGEKFKTDVFIDKAVAFEYDALLLPGGVKHIDKIRINPEAIHFVKSFIEEDKLIAAVCRASSILTETGLIRGKRLTSHPAIKTDMENAGAIWIDKEVVAHHGLITSRGLEHISKFNKRMIEEFSNIVSKSCNKNLKSSSNIHFPISKEFHFDDAIDKMKWDELENKMRAFDDIE